MRLRPRTVCILTKIPLMVFVLGGCVTYAHWKSWRAQNRLMAELVHAIRTSAPPQRAAMIEGREQIIQFLDALHDAAKGEPPESDMARMILSQIEGVAKQ